MGKIISSIKNANTALSKVIITTVISSLAIVGLGAATASATPTCTVTPLGGQGYSGHYFVNNGTSMTAQFTVSGDQGCTAAVTFSAFEAPNATFQPLSQQTLYAHTTGVYGIGTHTITVAIPDCYYQVDLLLGTSPTASDGTANFAWGQIIGYVQGGNKSCTQPTPPSPTPQPTPPPAAPTTITNNNTNNNVNNNTNVQSQSQSVQIVNAAATSTTSTPSSTAQTPSATAASTVQQLPNTGPGDVLGIGALVSIVSTIGYSLFQRYRLGTHS